MDREFGRSPEKSVEVETLHSLNEKNYTCQKLPLREGLAAAANREDLGSEGDTTSEVTSYVFKKIRRPSIKMKIDP